MAGHGLVPKITLADTSKTYGENDPDLSKQATVTGTVKSETLAYTVKRVAGENVNDYVMSIELSTTADVNKNYDIDATSTATFTINKKAAKITLADTSKTYGEEDPDLSKQASVTGTEKSETLAYTVKREAGENVDDYVMSIELSTTFQT